MSKAQGGFTSSDSAPVLLLRAIALSWILSVAGVIIMTPIIIAVVLLVKFTMAWWRVLEWYR